MPLWEEEERQCRCGRRMSANDDQAKGGSASTKFGEAEEVSEEEDLGGTREEGKRRSANADVGGGAYTTEEEGHDDRNSYDRRRF